MSTSPAEHPARAIFDQKPRAQERGKVTQQCQGSLLPAQVLQTQVGHTWDVQVVTTLLLSKANVPG